MQAQDTPPSEGKLALFGRSRFLIDKLADALHAAAGKKGHWMTDVVEGRRDSHFEVQIRVDGEPTGFIARVTVELDRFEDPDHPDDANAS